MMTCKWYRRWLPIVGLFFLTFAWVLGTGIPAGAEVYIAGFAGWSIPQKFDNVQTTQPIGPFPAGSSVSQLSLTHSIMYGGKVGYYFNSLKYLGIEAEVYTNTPNIRQQAITINNTPAGTLQGSDLRVITYGLNGLLRYPGERLQPYVGVGPALFQAMVHTQGDPDDKSTRLGLNAQTGLRFMLTKHLLLFGEYKFNYARFKF